MILDFEKARSGVIDVLRGKVGTPTAVLVVQALRDAAVEIEPQKVSDCDTCAVFHCMHYKSALPRINCPLWRAKG